MSTEIDVTKPDRYRGRIPRTTALLASGSGATEGSKPLRARRRQPRKSNGRNLKAGIGAWQGPRRIDLPEVRDSEIARRMREYEETAAGAYSPDHFKSMATAVGAWAVWCAGRGDAAYPADPAQLARFVDELSRTRRPTTVQGYLSSLSRLHRAFSVVNPVRTRPVELAVRRMLRANGRSRYQAYGITFDMRTRMVEAAPNSPKGKRNRAMLAVAYDAMLRAGELTAIVVEDITFANDGSAVLTVPRSKTDPKSVGATLFLASDTVSLVRSWLMCADIRTGPLFRGLRQAPRLLDEHVTFAFRELASLAGYPADIVDRITSHSPRVGVAQDMVAAGIDLAAIMQAARWRTTYAFSRYTQSLAPGRGASAHLARLQRPLGRDRILKLVSDGGAARGDADAERRIATAYHLAGRCYAAQKLGLPPMPTLYIYKEGYRQFTLLRQPLPLPECEAPDSAAARVAREDMAAAHCAGIAALSKHWREHNRRFHTRIELDQARNLLRKLASDEAELDLRLALARHRGAQLVAGDGAMAAIDRLAAALLTGERVTATTMSQFFGGDA